MAEGTTTRVVFNEAALNRLLKGPEGPVGLMLLKKGIQVERTAKHLAPVDTGRLRGSITHQLSRDARGLVCFVGTNVVYAIFQELGTRFMRAHPFLRPALRSIR